MSKTLPELRSKWKREAGNKQISPTQAMTAGTTFVSGSKFEFEHFLRLRVLYAQDRNPIDLATSPGFPKEPFKQVSKILRENVEISFLKNLKDREKIASEWNVESVKKSGTFATAMELLHLIAKRGVKYIQTGEDRIDLKIISSPPKKRSMTQSDAHYYKPLSALRSSTPTPESQGQSHLSDMMDQFDISGISEISQAESASPPNTDLRQAMYNFDRSEFVPGDEQTVNAALVALAMALSWELGYTGLVHHDRAKFSIPNDDTTYLYSACVDGLIMDPSGARCNGFMEVKRDLRGLNTSVRFQIAAQMAAFIYEQDVLRAGQVDEKETEKETKKTVKGKEKEVKARKDKDKGNQQLFRKWMVSLDGYWAYINIATYDRHYLDYLSGSQPMSADHGFMEMREYGYFDLRLWSGNGLELFLKCLGALMLGTLGP